MTIDMCPVDRDGREVWVAKPDFGGGTTKANHVVGHGRRYDRKAADVEWVRQAVDRAREFNDAWQQVIDDMQRTEPQVPEWFTDLGFVTGSDPDPDGLWTP